jgi:hypothetical protein
VTPSRLSLKRLLTPAIHRLLLLPEFWTMPWLILQVMSLMLVTSPLRLWRRLLLMATLLRRLSRRLWRRLLWRILSRRVL